MASSQKHHNPSRSIIIKTYAVALMFAICGLFVIFIDDGLPATSTDTDVMVSSAGGGGCGDDVML